MKLFIAWIFVLSCLGIYAQKTEDSLMIRKIYSYHLTESKSYSNLHNLCKDVGGRLSGSKEAAKSVEWAKQAMIKAGADTVFLVPCMVPHWIRGKKEKCEVSSAKNHIEALSVCALGGSIATPAKGIKAKVVEVSSFEELEKLGSEKIKGTIVFYNVSFDKEFIHTGNAYGKAVKYRSGASMAAKYGAIASVTKSMTTSDNDFPHTGMMKYDSLVTKIPAFAISAKGAKKLSSLLAQNKNLQMYLYTDCLTLPDELSYNVVGEIYGKEIPNELIVVGGHLDSWDLGEGAHDDGAGVVQSIELLAAFKRLGIKNKRSIRCVAFMNEENGTRGGTAYADYAAKERSTHIAALESDMGGFSPQSIGVDTKQDAFLYYKKWQSFFDPYFIFIKQGGGGADISKLIKLGVPQFSLDPDSQRYFDFHHTADDVFEQVNKRELEMGAATISSFIYLLDKYGAYK